LFFKEKLLNDKIEAVLILSKMGLTKEQVFISLKLSVKEVEQIINDVK